MSNEQFAFIETPKVPSPSQWQDAIDNAGFDLKIDPSLQPVSHTGFLPCTLLGASAGVEVYYDSASDVIPDLEQRNEIAAGRDFCITFRWGGSMQECACAMILSYALASAFDAIVSYEGDTPYASLEALRKDTEDIIQSMQKKNR